MIATSLGTLTSSSVDSAITSPPIAVHKFHSMVDGTKTKNKDVYGTTNDFARCSACVARILENYPEKIYGNEKREEPKSVVSTTEPQFFVEITHSKNYINIKQMRGKKRCDYSQYPTEQMMDDFKRSCKTERRSESHYVKPKISHSAFVRRKSENNTGISSLDLNKKESSFAQRRNRSSEQLTNSRRTSIDCSSSLNGRNTQGISHDTKVYTLEKHCVGRRNDALPPLISSPQAPSMRSESIRIPCSRHRRKRTVSGEGSEKSRPPSTGSRVGVNISSPISTSGMIRRNIRSPSVDQSQSMPSSTCRRRSSLGRHTSSSLNSSQSLSKNKLVTTNRYSFNDIQTARRQYTKVPSSGADSDVTGKLTEKSKGSNTECKIPSRPQSQLAARYRKTRSVYSSSSVGSTDRQSSNVVQPQRRASLPSKVNRQPIADTCTSPEYFKAFKELTLEANSQDDAKYDNKNVSGCSSSLERSSSSLAQGKDQPRLDLLQRIEEVTPENSFNVASQINLFKDEDSPMTKSTICHNEPVKEAMSEGLRSGPKQEAKNNLQDIEKSLKLAENKVRNEQLSDEKSGVLATTPKVLQPAQSFFLVPEIAKVKQGSSRIQHKKMISKNEENLHYVSGIPEENQRDLDNYLKICGCCEDEDDFIDIKTIYENDDDLCDEDFCRKRVILWIMAAQTGLNAEKVVRSNTPPPSPEPETKETAILVIYNEADKNR